MTRAAQIAGIVKEGYIPARQDVERSRDDVIDLDAGRAADAEHPNLAKRIPRENLPPRDHAPTAAMIKRLELTGAQLDPPKITRPEIDSNYRRFPVSHVFLAFNKNVFGKYGIW